MGCGCAERKRKMIAYLNRKGAHRTASMISKLPTPEGIKKRIVVTAKNNESDRD